MKRIALFLRFTLIELLVAMVVFSILILTMFELFAQVNDIWNSTRARVEIYEKARLFLEVVARDFEGYIPAATPGYQYYAQYLDKSNPRTRQTERFVFGASTRMRSGANSVSKICEVEYYFNKERGKVYYRLVGDDERNKGSAGWNFLSQDPSPLNPFLNTQTSVWNPRTGGDAVGKYVELVDCVTRFKILPYTIQDNQGKLATPKAKPENLSPLILGIDNTAKEYYYDAKGVRQEIQFPLPEFVRVEISLMDRDSWDRYERFKGSNAEFAEEILKNNTRHFVRVINIATGRNALDISKDYYNIK